MDFSNKISLLQLKKKKKKEKRGKMIDSWLTILATENLYSMEIENINKCFMTMIENNLKQNEINEIKIAIQDRNNGVS